MKTSFSGCVRISILLLSLVITGTARGQVSSKQFEATVLPLLDVEESYDFLRQHTEGLPPRPRDPHTHPRADEIEIGAGWSIEIPADASPPLVTASEELQRYLKDAMQTQVVVNRPARLGDWRNRRQVIVAAARDKLPGCGDQLKAAKDYQIMVAGNTVAVCGFDDRGAMYGLYNL
ncbi:MAG TPA: hypothetical protein PKY77_23195, partial [Phycisphaerae bacterium]|nr:hypothetical protein [Phycisphaerae bacterium]HRY71317.1 hypothetical protein [Phycisphaerae bacterium]HSA29705.1 hypothetical protein [Phycisphaerae bacterium]